MSEKKSLTRRREAEAVVTKRPSGIVERSPVLRTVRNAYLFAKAISSGSGVTFVGSPDWRNVIRLGSGASPDAERLTRGIALATSAYAYTAIRYRATKLAEAPLGVFEDTDEGERLLPDHPRAMLLREPSKDYDMGELLALTEAYFCVTGAALWKIDRTLAGDPGKIVPLSGDEFETERAGDRIYGRFVRTRNRSEVYAPEDVIYFRDMNPSGWHANLSKLDVALSLLDLGHQVNRTVRNFMRKAIFPGGIVSPHEDWHPDDDEWQRFKNEIDAWHGGPQGAGEPLVVEGGTTFSRTHVLLEDLLPETVLDRIEATTGSVFGVPPVVLGWLVGLKNSPWSQMGEARQMTVEDTVEPMWTYYGRKIEGGLLPREEREAGRRIRFDTSGVRAFQQDDKTRAEVSKLNADTWTRGERRVYTGMDLLGDERDDEIVGGSSPFGEIPVSTGGGSSPPASEEEDDDDDDDEEIEEDSAIARLLFEKAEGTISKADITWLNFEVATKAAESTWTRGISEALSELRGKTVALANRTLRGKTDASGIETKEIDPDSTVAFLLAFKKLIEEEGEEILRDAATGLVASTGRDGVRSVASAVGLSYTVLEPGLADFVAEEAGFLASVMGETTGRQVAGIVEKTLTRGGLISDLRKNLEDAASFSRKRAQLVARTETTRAWNGAQRRSLASWEEEQPEGVRTVKQWLSSRDLRVREEHAALDDGKLYRINEQFPNGLQQPGEPNCRCTLLYEIERTDG